MTPSEAGSPQDTGHLAPSALSRSGLGKSPGVAPSSPHLAHQACPSPSQPCLQVPISSKPRLPRQPKSCSEFQKHLPLRAPGSLQTQAACPDTAVIQRRQDISGCPTGTHCFKAFCLCPHLPGQCFQRCRSHPIAHHGQGLPSPSHGAHTGGGARDEDAGRGYHLSSSHWLLSACLCVVLPSATLTTTLSTGALLGPHHHHHLFL